MASSIQSARSLLPGEIQEAQKVFGTQIDYSKVKVIDGTYTRLQAQNAVCTPNGHIYWPKVSEKQNLVSTPHDAHIFIHEMAHVLQHQQGVNVKLKGCLALAIFASTAGRFGNPYEFKVGKPWSKYNIEQQAELVADAYCQDYSVILKQSLEPLFPNVQHMPLEGNMNNLETPLSQWLA